MGEGGMEGEGNENPLPNANTLGGGMGMEGERKEPRARMGGSAMGGMCTRGKGRGHRACKRAGDAQGEHAGCPQGACHWGNRSGSGRKGRVLAC